MDQDAQLDDVLEVLYAHAPACLLQGDVLSQVAHGTAPYSPGTSDITQTQRHKTR